MAGIRKSPMSSSMLKGFMVAWRATTGSTPFVKVTSARITIMDRSPIITFTTALQCRRKSYRLIIPATFRKFKAPEQGGSKLVLRQIMAAARPLIISSIMSCFRPLHLEWMQHPRHRKWLASPAKPELRIFAGSTANTYDRAEIDTAPDGDESWVGGHYPVTYSFTLLDFPVAPPIQCQIFLIPEGSLGGTPYTGNEYVDYNAPNELWLEINGMRANPDGSSGYNAQVAWKVGAPNTNPNNQALTPGNGVGPNGIYANQGNQSPVGTWTLKFTGPADGTLTPPGVTPLPFHISDPSLATDFAAPVLAVFGLQPNSGGAEGTYIDYAGISIAGTANPLSENFTSEAPGNTIESSGLRDTSDSAGAARSNW